MLLTQPIESDLLTSHKLSCVMIEYTTNCNMRCSYCSVSKSTWVGIDLEKGLSNRITQQVIDRNPDIVNMHGHGETTIIKGWEKQAQEFMEAGVGVGLCTNLAKKFSPEEMEVLSKIKHLTVSLDSVDIELFRKLRRGGDIRHVIYNLTKIQLLARKRGETLSISWSIVCCDKSIWGLVDLVEYGISLGVLGFTFCNLGASDVPEGATETKHVSELSVEDCMRAIVVFEKITILCNKNKCILDIKMGIIDTLNYKIKNGVTKWTKPGGYQPVLKW